jgi:NTE family protein
MITNLVFEGGGVKGIAFCGALKALEEKNILRNIKNVIGSSSGAMVALSVALKLSSRDVKYNMSEMDFNKIMDKRFGLFGKLYYFVIKYGIYKGNYLYSYLGKIIEEQTGNKNITFKELYRKTKINLVITGTNVDKGIVEYFNHKTHPNMPVRLAVRISMSIPYVFEAVRYNGDTYVDGGILNNYPINYFKDIENTIGLKLVGPDEKRDGVIKHYDNNINNIKDFSLNIINSMLNQIERLYITDDYWKRTITINTFDINTTDFNLSDEQKEKLILEGYRSTIEYFL